MEQNKQISPNQANIMKNNIQRVKSQNIKYRSVFVCESDE